MLSDSLNVIALISGGKDSFYSILHCQKNGHRVVALANLFPLPKSDSDGQQHSDTGVQFIDPCAQPAPEAKLKITSEEWENNRRNPVTDKDLNSFMYQTVGHEIIPLYARATGLPLYRQPILGNNTQSGKEYDPSLNEPEEKKEGEAASDETESMIPLLKEIKARHPKANAICTGAILSTYQRTRVESVAIRLGLVPLAYLWQYTSLPTPVGSLKDDAQLLRDMAMAGLEARIIKVASGGLNERHLWLEVSSDSGAEKIKRAMRKFGPSQGSTLGEGGEFETIVLDGPSTLFNMKIAVPPTTRTVIREGGGSVWLQTRCSYLENKYDSSDDDTVDGPVRRPRLFDAKFKALLGGLEGVPRTKIESSFLSKFLTSAREQKDIRHHGGTLSFSALATYLDGSIEQEMRDIVEQTRDILGRVRSHPGLITNTVLLLRDMADFAKANEEYGKLFSEPLPASRVTISCGGQMIQGHRVVLLVTALSKEAARQREGLHVQSRSYWAPANIGPYSQAIQTLATANSILRTTIIAGQIPLIPASMKLLEGEGPEVLEESVVLALQHLWRVGKQMNVQLWSSAVAYFPRCHEITTSGPALQRHVRLAANAWEKMHASPGEGEDETDDETDLWDRRYNPAYLTLAQGTDGQNRPLPDLEAFTLRQRNEPASVIPPFFAVEVEELPRQAAVEWQAHVGISGVKEGRAEMQHTAHSHQNGGGNWFSSTLLCKEDEEAVVCFTTLQADLYTVANFKNLGVLNASAQHAHHEALQTAGLSEPSEDAKMYKAYLVYVDGLQCPALKEWYDPSGQEEEWLFPEHVIPCRSIWSVAGARLGAVVLFRATFPVDK